MTARARRPTDEDGTGVYDPERRRALSGAPAASPVAPVSPASWDHDATEVTPWPDSSAVDHATPTHVDASRPIEQGTPTEVVARPERSEPIRVISMKDRSDGDRPRGDRPRVPLHVQLRSMAEVAGRRDPRSGLGHLAPPHDPQKARKRRQRDNVVWACVAIGLACGISLAIWLIAGR